MEPLFKPKFFSVLKKGYSKEQFRKDLFAGIIVGIVALPLAIAFAVASGVSPEKGLVTAVIAGFIISFLGGSRVQIGGPTGAFVVIVSGVVTQYGLQGLLISTVMAGIILILFGLFKLGSVLKYIPHPLITGFTSGIALVIFTTQIRDAFGITIGDLPAGFIAKWSVYLSSIDTINPWALAITIVTIIITVFSGKIIPKIPGSFIAIILLTLVVNIFHLPVSTIQTVFGSIPNTFRPGLPHIDLSQITNYLQPAFTIAMLCAIESLLSAVVADGMIGGNHRSNTELIAQGIANIVTPFFGGIPATGAIARTATNIRNGGRTPMAGIIHAGTLLVIMLFMGKLAMLIPMSCLAGILIVVSYNMSEWKTFVSILKSTKYDIFILLTTFILTVLVDLTMAIEIGMVLAALLFMQRMARTGAVVTVDPESDVYENYSTIPSNIDIYEISGPFFFAAAKKYKETLKNINAHTEVLIIRMRHVPFIDKTGIDNFRDTIRDIQSRKTKILLSGVQPEVLAELERSRIAFLIGRANIFVQFDEALKKAIDMSKKNTSIADSNTN